MGVDYYESKWLVITEIDGESKEYIRISSEGGYFNFTYDSDEEDGYSKAKVKYFRELRKQASPPKILFQDGEWKITSKSKIEVYLLKLKEKGIPIEKVVKIVKTIDFEER